MSTSPVDHTPATTLPAASTSTEVKQGALPIQLDVGFLTTVDPNSPDLTKLSSDLTKREAYLRTSARNATQALLNSVFTLPYTKHPEYGPLATLPPILVTDRVCEPREKPLPKPGGKPLTKWEKFAKAKGISHSTKDRKVWDDEKKEWVNRWGYQGANKDAEEQWLHEVPANAGMFSCCLSCILFFNFSLSDPESTSIFGKKKLVLVVVVCTDSLFIFFLLTSFL